MLIRYVVLLLFVHLIFINLLPTRINCNEEDLQMDIEQQVIWTVFERCVIYMYWMHMIFSRDCYASEYGEDISSYASAPWRCAQFWKANDEAKVSFWRTGVVLHKQNQHATISATQFTIDNNEFHRECPFPWGADECYCWFNSKSETK